MKKKRLIFAGAMVLVLSMIAAAAIFPPSKWSDKVFQAVVQETVTRPGGEVRLIVERVTEVYANPCNSLRIGGQTELAGEDGRAAAIEDFRPGDRVEVTLKDSFVEETPFYYPTVYKVKKLV